MSTDPVAPWMLAPVSERTRRRHESCGWLVDAVDAIESAVRAAEGWESVRLVARLEQWRDPDTGRLADDGESLDRALSERRKRHADAGTTDLLAVALAGARRALVSGAGWSETLAASVLQDEALWLDPAAPDAAPSTLAVAASVVRRRVRHPAEGG